MHPTDKTRTRFLNEFLYYRAPGRKQEGVSRSPQWDGFFVVLSTSDIKLSLSCRCRKPNVEGRAQWEQNGRNETKCIDPEWSSMQQKVKNEGENPPIYNKILGHSRSWCMIKIMLIKSRSTFMEYFIIICWRERVFDLGQIPWLVRNK